MKNISYEDIYIYGAGRFGVDCLHLFKTCGYDIKGFLVTDISYNSVNIEGVPVYSFNEIQNKENIVIVISTGYKFADEMFNTLKENGFNMNNVFFFKKNN